MDKITEIFFFGKAAERFSLITRIYLLVICIMICNHFMNSYGYTFDKKDVTWESIINFILSDKFIVASTVFFVVFLVVFFVFRIAIKFLAEIVLLLLFRFLDFVYALLKWQKPIFQKIEIINFIVALRFVSINNNVVYKERRFIFFKTFISELNDDSNKIFDGSYTVAACLITT